MPLMEQAFANVRADEARAAGDEKIHCLKLTFGSHAVEHAGGWADSLVSLETSAWLVVLFLLPIVAGKIFAFRGASFRSKWSATGMELHYRQLGQGAPLVLIHGLFGSGDNWLGVAPRLAERFHVFAPDLRNHGHSPHATFMDYPGLAADVAKFMARCGLARAGIIGHSLGGKVAMQLAMDHPGLVEKLVVVDMAPRAYQPVHIPILEALAQLPIHELKTRQDAEAALAGAIPSLNLRRFLLKNLTRNEQGNFVWRMNLAGLADNYLRLGEALAAGPSFPGPTLFIRGGKSEYITAADEPGIKSRFPAASLQTIPTANHWVHADAPAAFLDLILAYL